MFEWFWTILSLGAPELYLSVISVIAGVCFSHFFMRFTGGVALFRIIRVSLIVSCPQGKSRLYWQMESGLTYPLFWEFVIFKFYYQDITIIVKTILLKISVQTQNVILGLLMNVRFSQTQQGSQQFRINHYKYHMRRQLQSLSTASLFIWCILLVCTWRH